MDTWNSDLFAPCNWKTLGADIWNRFNLLRAEILNTKIYPSHSCKTSFTPNCSTQRVLMLTKTVMVPSSGKAILQLGCGTSQTTRKLIAKINTYGLIVEVSQWTRIKSMYSQQRLQKKPVDMQVGNKKTFSRRDFEKFMLCSSYRRIMLDLEVMLFVRIGISRWAGVFCLTKNI